MTFLLPEILFVFVAGWLLILYTKPGLIPGRRAPGAEVQVGATRHPGRPASVGKHAEGRAGGAQAGTGPAAPADPASVE